MDLFGGALASIAGGGWTNMIMPSQGNVNMVAQGNVNMVGEGSVSMVNQGSVSMVNQGNVSGLYGGYTSGSYTPGIFETQQFGSGVSQVVGGVTGTSNEIIVGPNPFATSGSMQMGGGYCNPFPGWGFPNPFFAAQLFGGCNSFYQGLGGAFG